MSWESDIQNIVFTITTGDGKNWQPKWRNAVKDVEYNASVFEFVEVEGSLVLRKKMKGRKFDLEFYFDGENSVNIGNSFEFSARDSRPWTIKHPFYGDFKCQPLSLKQDNTSLNVSKFTVPVTETITDSYPVQTKVFQDEIISQVEVTNELQALAFSESKELDKVELSQNVSFFDKTYSKIIKTNDELREFKSKVSDCVTEINNTSSTALSIMRSIQSLINYPATIEQTIESRIIALRESMMGIIDSFDGNNNQFEALAGCIISSMQLVYSNASDTDFDIRSKIIKEQTKLLAEYTRYMMFLDSLQTDRADSNDSYMPNYSAQNSLNILVGINISNLYNMVFKAKQEREYVLDKDSNVIILTHKLYGLDKNDQNIEKFIRTNNIGLNEILNIRKGRKVVYYV